MTIPNPVACYSRKAQVKCWVYHSKSSTTSQISSHLWQSIVKALQTSPSQLSRHVQVKSHHKSSLKSSEICPSQILSLSSLVPLRACPRQFLASYTGLGQVLKSKSSLIAFKISPRQVSKHNKTSPSQTTSHLNSAVIEDRSSIQTRICPRLLLGQVQVNSEESQELVWS